MEDEQVRALIYLTRVWTSLHTSYVAVHSLRRPRAGTAELARAGPAPPRGLGPRGPACPLQKGLALATLMP